MYAQKRSSPVGTIAIWGALIMLAAQGGLDFVGDLAVDTWAHIDSAVPGQADADAYSCRVASAMQDDTGEWLLTPDNPDVLDCP